jgi:hypothetical protein
MIKTALDDIPTPPSAKLLGWRLLDARPKDGWLKRKLQPYETVNP